MGNLTVWVDAGKSAVKSLYAMIEQRGSWTGWSLAEAEIISCEIQPVFVELASFYVPKITYTFEIDERRYINADIFPRCYRYRYTAAQEAFKAYSKGTVVCVRYNSCDPNQSNLWCIKANISTKQS
jgi:hypothetical protein